MLDTKTVDIEEINVVAVQTPPPGDGLEIGGGMGLGLELELELIGGLTGGVVGLAGGTVGNGNVVGRVRVDVGPSMVDGVKITGPLEVVVRGGS